MKDPNLSEYADRLGITADWLKKKMKQLGITGYKDGRSTRLTSLDQAKISTAISYPNTRTHTRTPEPEYPNFDTRTPESGYYSSGVAIAPIVEVIEMAPAPRVEFAPLTFQVENHGASIAALTQSIGDLHSRRTNHFDSYEQSLIATAAQRGIATGLAAGQAYLAGHDHALTVTLGKPVGGNA